MENIKEKFEFEVSPEYEGMRLDKYLAEQIEEATRSYLEKLIDNSYVKINSKVINKNGRKLKSGEKTSIKFVSTTDMQKDAKELSFKFLPYSLFISFIFSKDLWFFSSKNLIDVISSPNNSILYGWSSSIENISIIYPLDAKSPVLETILSSWYPKSKSFVNNLSNFI